MQTETTEKLTYTLRHKGWWGFQIDIVNPTGEAALERFRTEIPRYRADTMSIELVAIYYHLAKYAGKDVQITMLGMWWFRPFLKLALDYRIKEYEESTKKEYLAAHNISYE